MPFRIPRVLLLIAVFVSVCSASSPNSANTSFGSARIPLLFEKNVGQADANYSYVLNRPGMRAVFEATGVNFQLLNKAGHYVSIPLQFEHSGSTAVVGQDALDSKVNYLIGSDSKRWKINVPSFGKLRYQSVFTGIDLLFYGNGEEMEHDFIVQPGADPSMIGMSVGQAKIEITPAGDAYLTGDDVVLKLHRPIAYQQTPSGRVQIAADFRLQGKRLGFKVGAYRHDLPLVIDPAVSFSTYIANGNGPVVGVATDAAGNTYVVGYTFATNFPLVNAFQSTCANCSNTPDAFVVKLNSTGTAVLYSTYIGGSQYDQPVGIQVDASGNAIIAGRTNSIDYPLHNPWPNSSTQGQSYDGFLTSLSADGSSLNYSTLLGHALQGYASDTTVTALGVGTDGAAYVVGRTGDPNFPVTSGAMNSSTPVYPDSPAYLTKFSNNGSVIYSAIIGNPATTSLSGSTDITSLAVDSSGAAYLAGRSSPGWPTTPGAYQTSITSESSIVVSKVSADASSFIYSTYIGNSASAQPAGIAVDPNGAAWVTGSWADSNYPLTALNLGYSANSGQPFLSKLSPAGDALQYSTFLSGSSGFGGSTYPSGVALDSHGHVWIAGYNTDGALPLVNPIQSAIASSFYSSTSGFIMEIDPVASKALFSSYYGGQAPTQISALAIDSNDRVHIGGWALQNLYTTPGAYIGTVTAPPQYVQYLFPFVSLIDPTIDAPSVCVVSSPYFFATKVGTTGTSEVQIKNCGNATANTVSIVSGDPHFTIPSGQNFCTSSLAPGATCNFELDFAPTEEARYTSQLTFNAGGNSGPFYANIAADGAVPHATVYGTTLVYDPLLIGESSTETTYILNFGQIPLQVNLAGATITGDYTLVPSYCPASTPAHDPCIISVQFTPTAAGERDGTLVVATDDPANPTVTFTLKGSAVAAYPVPTITSLDFSAAPIGGTNLQVRINGTNFFPASTVWIDGVVQSIQSQSNGAITFDLDPSLLTKIAELPVTVSNPVPGGGVSNSATLTVYQRIDGFFRHLVFNPVDSLLYVSIPATAPNNANTVQVINPADGSTVRSIAVGNNPNQVGLSSDRHYLFVGLDGDHTIARINLTTNAVEKTYSLPTDAIFGGPETVSQFLAAPQNPTMFLASLSATRSPSSDGVALFNDAGMVNQVPYPTAAYSMVFAGDPTTFYATPFEMYGASFAEIFTIDAAGVHYNHPSGGYVGSIANGTITSDGTLLYVSDGSVLDPVTKTKVGSYGRSFDGPILPDTPNHHLIAVDPFAQTTSGYSAVSFDTFDQTSHASTGELTLSQQDVGIDVVDLARWGTDGLAFVSTYDYSNSAFKSVNILRSRIISGNPVTPVFAIYTLSPSQALVGSGAQVVTVTGFGFRQDTTATVNGTALASTWVSGTEMTLTLPANLLQQSGTLQINLSNQASGGGTVAHSFSVVGIPQLSLSSGSLDFGTATVNTKTAAKVVTISNGGSAALHITSITVSGDFQNTTACGTSLSAGGSCTLNISFAPTASGTRNGSLVITDDSAGSSHSISLTGTGADFEVGSGSGSSTTQTVTAGQAATYNLMLASSGGFSGSVSLQCTGAPQYASCLVTPSSVNLSSGASSSVTVTISTSQTTTSAALRNFEFTSSTLVFVSGVLLLAPRRKANVRRVPSMILCTALIGLAGATLSSCGGGGATKTPTPTSVTHTVAPGTYTLQLAQSSGTTQKATPLTLIVK